MKITILCLINTLLMVGGQTLFKIGSRGKNLNTLKGVVEVVFSPIIITALFLYAGTTVLWLFILSKTDISFAYPIQALAFPLVLIIASTIFHEPISNVRWLGVVIIIIGVYIATKG